MEPIELLRRLLDERGAEWWVHEAPAEEDCTAFFDGESWHDCWECGGGKINVVFALTPEQAIEAAFGGGECHNTSYRLDESRFHCSECGFGCWVKDVADGRDKVPRHCPNCGRKVVGE